ncbi:MAG: hypothetical protein EAZ99_04150 [Alphaproteobacteria bacterium]|nr:hypothetical protein [Alphaproteobacteria bacterium]TAD90986.1 MAG: hypothetical protein EAZ99_04150 [Alphaproteobacteria bacterium]
MFGDKADLLGRGASFLLDKLGQGGVAGLSLDQVLPMVESVTNAAPQLGELLTAMIGAGASAKEIAEATANGADLGWVQAALEKWLAQ